MRAHHAAWLTALIALVVGNVVEYGPWAPFLIVIELALVALVALPIAVMRGLFRQVDNRRREPPAEVGRTATEGR
jgi:hypothetical protein